MGPGLGAGARRGRLMARGSDLMGFVLGLVATVAIVYMLILGYLWVSQRSFVFRPGFDRPVLAGSAVDLLMQDVFVESQGGPVLHAWYAPAKHDMPTILYFHGNAGTLAGRAERVLPYLQRGYGMLLVGYRGYGGNSGEPTELGLYADGRAHFDWLLANGVPNEQIVLYGESLGSGVAVQLATERPVRALVLEAPFASVPLSAKERFPLFAFEWLIKDKFANIDKIDRVRTPVFIVHGSEDRVTPMKFGRMLFDKAKEPKGGLWPQGAGHNDLVQHGMIEGVMDFLDAVSEGR